MGLEGNLRDLALGEVLQLLSLGRKTGTLHLHDALAGRAAAIVVEYGAVVRVATGSSEEALTFIADTGTTLEDQLLALLRWTDGSFRFESHDAVAATGQRRISLDQVLMEHARQADAWSALGGRISGPDIVPSFPDVQPRQLSLLHLSPDQWEVLTCTDGNRTLAEVARLLRRDIVEVAHTIDSLVTEGVLVVKSVVRTGIAREEASIPPVFAPELPFGTPLAPGEEDSIFDPMQVGVMTPDGMPVMSGGDVTVRRVAGGSREPSLKAGARASANESRRLLDEGDDAARRGDLDLAIAQWSQWLGQHAHSSQAARVQERIAAAVRLRTALQS